MKRLFYLLIVLGLIIPPQIHAQGFGGNIAFGVPAPAVIDLAINLVFCANLSESSGTRVDLAHGSNLVENGSVTGTSGGPGGALVSVFTPNAFLSHSSNSFIRLDGEGDTTISAWVYVANALTAYSFVTKFNNPDGDYALDVEANTGKVRFYIGWGGPAVATSTASLAANTWYYLRAEHNTITEKTSISINNGTPDISAGSGIPTQSNTEFRIGASARTGNENYLAGRMAMVKIWKRLLNSTEKAADYNAGSGLPCT